MISAVLGVENWVPLPLSPDFVKKSPLEQADQGTAKNTKLTIQREISSGGQNTSAEAGQKDAALVGFVNAPTVITVASDQTPFQLMNQPTVKMVTLDGCLCPFNVLGKNTLTVTVPAGSFDDRPFDSKKLVAHRLTVTITGASEAADSDRARQPG